MGSRSPRQGLGRLFKGRGTSTLARAVGVALALASGVAFPACKAARSVVNDSDGLRWWLFSNFGASRICPEAMERGLPLKLSVFGPSSIGRFFPEACQVTVNDPARSIVVEVRGTGYAYLPLARRVGFFTALSVAYRPDFRLEDDAMYVWGRFDRMIREPELRLLSVENPMVSLATVTPVGGVATLLGQSVVSSEVGRGFTVVRQDDGDTFALGILSPPQKPPRPMAPGHGRQQLVADSTEIHASNRDYVGPFAVKAPGVLHFRRQVSGATGRWALVSRADGERWRRDYQAGMPLGPPPAPPLAYGGFAPGEGEDKVSVAPGSYYLVLENPAVPPVAPLGMPLPFPEALAYVAYSVEWADPP